MMCTGPQMQLETQLYELLDGPLTYRLDHRTLTLTDAGGKGLGAKAATGAETDAARTGGTSEGGDGTEGQEPPASR